jgi:hypothetical protein
MKLRRKNLQKLLSETNWVKILKANLAFAAFTFFGESASGIPGLLKEGKNEL